MDRDAPIKRVEATKAIMNCVCVQGTNVASYR